MVPRFLYLNINGAFGANFPQHYLCMKQVRTLLLYSALLTIILLSSCKPTYLAISGVGYQSLQMKRNEEQKQNDTKTITIYCFVDQDGNVEVIAENNSDKIMTIDRTKSFFQNQNDLVQMYYDPTVQTNTTSTTQGSGKGVGVNLGAVAGAVGIGGVLGTALSGVTVGGSNSMSTTNTNTTYVIDQPKVSIPPHGRVSMGRIFQITGIGKKFLQQAVTESYQDVNNAFTKDNSYAVANICVSYSVDEENSFQFIETQLYATSILISKVRKEGSVNEALRTIYLNKPDALAQPWYLLYFAQPNWFYANRENNHKLYQQTFVNYQ